MTLRRTQQLRRPHLSQGHGSTRVNATYSSTLSFPSSAVHSDVGVTPSLPVRMEYPATSVRLPSTQQCQVNTDSGKTRTCSNMHFPILNHSATFSPFGSLTAKT